jgi:hypothetical protein
MAKEEKLMKEITLLKERLELLLKLVGAVGLPSDPWVSPEQAGPILGISPNSIRERIKRAEERRIARQRCECSYGVHYRNDAAPTSKMSAWKVNLIAWDRLLKDIPPDQRTV